MKKTLALVVTLLMMFALVACQPQQPAAPAAPAETASAPAAPAETAAPEAPAESGNYKIGLAFYNLQNPVWAEVVEEAVRYGAEKGCSVTYVDAGENSATQISQIENFMQSGVDALGVLAVDNESIEAICKEAMDAGIKVVDYSRGIKNAYCTLTLNPYKDAEAIVALAKPFIEAKYGDKEFEWAHLDIPTVEVGVIQGKAIEAEMLRVFPNSKLVFNGATLTTEQGMNNTEAALQAHPNLRVILSQSAGGGVGGNEAIKAAISPDEYDDYLLFSIDATEQELQNIMAGDPQKGSIGLGGGAEHGRCIIDLCLKLLAGETVEYDQSLPITIVTKETAQAYFDKTYKK